jgi:PhnB protein
MAWPDAEPSAAPNRRDISACPDVLLTDAPPAGELLRLADWGRSRNAGVGHGIISGEESGTDSATPGGGEESSHDAKAPSGWPKGGHDPEAGCRGHRHAVRHPDAFLRGRDRGPGMADQGVWVSGKVPALGPGRSTLARELEAGDGLIMLASPTPDYQGPKRHREVCEQARKWSAVPWIIDGVLVFVDDLDAHFARAKAVGATILSGIEAGPPGRRYRAEDLEGHRWFFFEKDGG